MSSQPSLDVGRIGGIAGLLSVVGILAFGIIGPMLVAGPRVSGTLDEAAIRAYYAHAPLALLAAGSFLLAPLMVVLFAALDQNLRDRGGPAFASRLGFYFGLANVPLYLLTAALGGVLVTLAETGQPLLPTFRLWDVYYNSAGYAFEVGFLVAFAAAMRGTSGWPRGLAALGFGAAALQAFNLAAPWWGLPDAATMPGNLLLMGFLAWTSIHMLRAPPAPAAAPRAAPV